MKEIVFGALALGVVGYGVYKGAPATSAANTYEMTQEQAVEKLLDNPIKPSTVAFESPFGNLEVRTRNPAPNRIVWAAAGSHAAILCEATLTPVETTHVRVETECDGSAPSDGVTQGAANDITNIAMHEFVESTLEDRPFNSSVVSAAATAAFAKRYPGMVKDAVGMDMEMRKMKAEEAKGL